MFIDNFLVSIEQDPIYLILIIIFLLILAFSFAKSLTERIIDGIADYLTDETKPTEERAQELINHISSGLDIAMSKVGKRKGFINFIKKVVTSDGTKKYLIKVMNKYSLDNSSTSQKE